MAQASVLTDNEIRRVFRIIETTRHAERNRLAFVLSIYAGLRVGEIAALTIGDVAKQTGEARREIKLGAHQTKGSKGRTVVLSNRVRGEIDSHLKTRPNPRHDAPLIRIAAQWAGFLECQPIDAVQGNLRGSGHSDILAFRPKDFPAFARTELTKISSREIEMLGTIFRACMRR